ncbi:MAG: nicotinate-nicotinamide nucleotide adenylyltransferase [Candidatus Gottesmanbacteria bacterium]
MRIGLFGGSFDPPHNGHLSIIDQAFNKNLVDEVWIIPTWKNAWKEEEANPGQRLAMCQLLINSNIKIIDLEIKRENTSYTIDTVLELKRLYDHQFFWLIGNDHLADLEKFKDSGKLLKEIIFIGFPRTNVSSSEIRNRIKRGELISSLVPKRVEEFIRNNNLYK